MIARIQAILGVRQDSVWGPISQRALIDADAATKRRIQKLLGVEESGVWDTVAQAALNRARGEVPARRYKASSFADPADVREFLRRKAQGMSDREAFKYGDNGIGQFGRITAQEETAMCAIHRKDMLARWGSEEGAAHRPVIVTVNGFTFTCTCEDRISVPDRIDLNPGAAKRAQLDPPFVVDCSWKWGDAA